MSTLSIMRASMARVSRFIQDVKFFITAWMVAFLLVIGGAFPVTTFAQTPVPLVVPTNEIFTQTNTWMGVFAPVVAIGVGIAVALAILGFIGNEILKAFR
jgi:hypothetical protein